MSYRSIRTVGDMIVALEQLADTLPQGKEQPIVTDFGGGPGPIQDLFFDKYEPPTETEDEDGSDCVVIACGDY